MRKYDFNKVKKQLYLSHASVWVFSFTFAAYFLNTSRGLLLFTARNLFFSDQLLESQNFFRTSSSS